MAISYIICISQYIVRRVTLCGTRKQEMHAEFVRNFLGSGLLEE